MYEEIYGIKEIYSEEEEYEEEEYEYGEGERIILSDDVEIDISDREKLYTWGIFGMSGRGKTTALVIIANQHRNVILFDSKGGAVDLIQKERIRGWKYYTIGGEEKELKINVRDLSPSSINVLYPGLSYSQQGRIRMMRDFFKLSPSNPEKNYDEFKRRMEELNLHQLLDEMSLILDENDKGIDLVDLCRGKWLVDASAYDFRNRSIGVLVDSLFFMIKRNKPLQEERVLIATDDIQRIGQANMAFGEAMGILFSQCRQFNVSGLVAGTNLTKLHPLVKQNISIKIIFETEYDREALKNMYDIYFDEYTLEEKAKLYGKIGTALLKTSGLEYDDGIVVHFDMKYLKRPPKKKKIKNKKRIDTSMIDSDLIFT